MLVFGGEDVNGLLSDTWLYDIVLDSWEEITSPGPPAWSRGVMYTAGDYNVKTDFRAQILITIGICSFLWRIM